MKTIIINGLAVLGLVSILSSISSNSQVENVDKTENDLSHLGLFSVSLAVNNIKNSLSFYEKIGFNVVEGNVSQNWVLLSNGASKIGLFQGMFPKNTITFNPIDARTIHSEITDAGVETIFSSGLESPQGPCSFSISDPDGNPILIDQH